jgi:hypothetical protein
LSLGLTGTLASGIGAYYGWKAVKRRRLQDGRRHNLLELQPSWPR